MATTRIISLHISKGKSANQNVKERLDYIMNLDKTEGGTLVTTYGCAQKTAASEFMLLRSEYLMNTGRDIQNEIIGYHVRQAFKPGEITPEEANRIGKELASKIPDDKYAYVVATHNTREHFSTADDLYDAIQDRGIADLVDRAMEDLAEDDALPTRLFKRLFICSSRSAPVRVFISVQP